jgi:hypothetical protein
MQINKLNLSQSRAAGSEAGFFACRLPFCREKGFGTGAEALLFAVLAGLSGQKGEMVVCAVMREPASESNSL